mmetsp:Transcript_12100/g.44144  ORF Transcript_12100/g.44144 Transcript_12100/m.44144 type:complete len:307 (+) Transcript_12100:198-1118(+)
MNSFPNDGSFLERFLHAQQQEAEKGERTSTADVVQTEYQDGDNNDPSDDERESDDEQGEEYEEEESLMPQALAVEGSWDPRANSGPPVDGMDYLRRVRWEAARTPSIAQAAPPAVDVGQADKREPSKHTRGTYRFMTGLMKPPRPPPPHLAPCPHWQRDFVASFSAIRLQVADVLTRAEEGDASVAFFRRAPRGHATAPTGVPGAASDEASWKSICLGAEASEGEGSSGFTAPHPPLLSVLGKLDSIGRVSVLSPGPSADASDALRDSMLDSPVGTIPVQLHLAREVQASVGARSTMDLCTWHRCR